MRDTKLSFDNYAQNCLIQKPSDIAIALSKLKLLCQELKLPEQATNNAVTAASELAHNILAHAVSGRLRLSGVKRHGRQGIQVWAEDSGPGIEDIDAAMRDNYSTRGTLGMGLPSVKRLADDFSIASSQEGTQVVFLVWGDGS